MGTGLYLRNEFLYQPVPLHVGSVGRYNDTGLMAAFAGTPGFSSAAWPGNDRALYAPVNIPYRFTVARFFVANSTNLTGNIDVGIYDAAGNRLLSTGTTARAGSGVLQYVGVADQSFPPGRYYLALVGSSTTGTYMATTMPSINEAKACGWLEEALGSTVLPASMTPTTMTAGCYMFGFTQSDTL